MADDTTPDYELEETLTLTTPEQYRALFEDTRRQIIHLLLERAATISELASTLGKPKGTVGHHVSALEEAGLIRVVRTKKVRALEAKYYGRTARTFILSSDEEGEVAPDVFLSTAAAEYATAAYDGEEAMISTLGYARIPGERAKEWALRLGELAQEFTSQKRGGDTTYGIALALYPTNQAPLPEPRSDD